MTYGMFFAIVEAEYFASLPEGAPIVPYVAHLLADPNDAFDQLELLRCQVPSRREHNKTFLIVAREGLEDFDMDSIDFVLY